ncbi:conserved hypothetical protein [Methanosalsum zhilinae DSM 4017]|uniref:Blue (Type 1) copper domain protein n=1 Tax=Methanosalsum zhilinae (strain DSM 4017 / NBRC 107636 / OCM 62 / WeN5) TaxID=679901 RepID=F7XPI7_METZD|nr:hypothetical protein [Methanosalsum zhilinae]AEH61412.1 conserved hypothetical protein [Methanosalsum zhilinae DSM 4017]
MNTKGMLVLLVLAITGISLSMGCLDNGEPLDDMNNTIPSADGNGDEYVDIVLESFTINPDNVTISEGDTVRWINKGPRVHRLLGADFDSGIIEVNETFTHTFESKGQHDYLCIVTALRGTVIVE